MYSTISKIIPAQKITVNLVVFNLVVKMHNGRSRNYYKVGFNFRLEIIRLKLAKFRLNIPITIKRLHPLANTLASNPRIKITLACVRVNDELTI